MNGQIQVAFLTGQSDPHQLTLSPAQWHFARSLPVPPEVIVPHNFPYLPHGSVSSETTAWQPTPLLLASVRNTAHYLSSRRPSFARRWRDSVLALLDQADHTLLLAGSCGLELLTNLHLTTEELRGVRVVAYGPVARGVPLVPCVCVVGNRDRLSLHFFPSPDVLVQAQHLNYLDSPKLHRIVVAELTRLDSDVPRGVSKRREHQNE